MNRIGKFSKVSFEQFYEAMKDCFYEENPPENEIREMYDKISLPKRATAGSSGYDFTSPINFAIHAGQSIKIPTGIHVYMENGWWLGCFPRSGLGVKYRMQIDNTIGVIDSDYFNSNNEGHIFIQLTNDSKDSKTLRIKAGERFIQGIFIPYGITYDDAAAGARNGGFGSTGTSNVIEFAQVTKQKMMA